MADDVPPTTVLFDFSGLNVTELAAACADDPVMDIVREVTPPGGRVLEAGAGSGKWLKALADRGYRPVGIEMNGKNVERFRAVLPDMPYDVGDVENLPYPDASFETVISLGVVEHLFHGPEAALAEMRRVLRPGGAILLTVPDANPSFALERLLDEILHRAYRSGVLRRILRRPPLGYSLDGERRRLATVRRRRREFPVKYGFERDVGENFYEYRFTPPQIARLMTEAGFVVDSVRLLYPVDRLYQVFGRLVGRRGGDGGPPRLNRFGQLLLRAAPPSWIDHMVAVIAHAPPEPSSLEIA